MSTPAIKMVHGWALPAADEFMSRSLGTDGTYQLKHLTAALAYVTDFSCAIDGGAHVGAWSRRMASVFQRVIAVEPSADTFAALTVNMETFQAANVELKACALGAKPGVVTMALDALNAARKNTGARHVQAGGTIPVEAIDDWALPSLGFLKLDIEGSEPDALLGASKTLRRCQPIVLFENKHFWMRYGHPRYAPQAILRGLGYRHKQTVGKDEIWGVPA